jgi:hypothetical protein
VRLSLHACGDRESLSRATWRVKHRDWKVENAAHVTPTLWIGIITTIEILRIGMTTYVLLHLLESRALRRDGELVGSAHRSLRAAPARARREALLDPTLAAIRQAMEDVATGRAGSGIDDAIAALDRYALALAQVNEEQRQA